MAGSDDDESKKRSINEMFGEDSDDDDDQIRPVSSGVTADASGLFGSDSESDDEPAPKKAKADKASHSNSSAQASKEQVNSGDEYESEEEGARNKEDDEFIDGEDDLADVLQEYNQDAQNFNDTRPSGQPDPLPSKKQEDFFEQTLRSLKTGRRSKMKLSAQEMEHLAQEVLFRMDKAHADDLAALNEGKVPFNKIKYCDNAVEILRKQQLQPILLDFDLLSIIKKWIQPMEDGTLTNVGVRSKMLQTVDHLPIYKEHLKRSGFGKVVMALWKHPNETRDNKEICRGMIDRWSRSVFNKTLDYSKLSELEAEKAENGGYRQHKSIQKKKQEGQGAESTSGGWAAGSERAAMPQQMRFDFIARPRPKGMHAEEEDEEGRRGRKKLDPESRKGRLAKRMQAIARPGKKSKRSQNMSIEGR